MSDENAAVAQVSAIICTRNRGDKIASAVSSVLSCDFPSFDLTIIDQSTDDLTPRRGGGDRRSPSAVRAQHRAGAVAGPTTTACASRSGEIIVFTDDDCLVDPDWITKIVEAFEAEPDGDLLYGRVVAAGAGADDVALTPALDLQAPERLAKGEGFKVWGMGADFAARRRLFDRAGYFDEMLGGGGPLWSSQDYDLAYRTYQAGGVISCAPRCTSATTGVARTRTGRSCCSPTARATGPST